VPHVQNLHIFHFLFTYSYNSTNMACTSLQCRVPPNGNSSSRIEKCRCTSATKCPSPFCNMTLVSKSNTLEHYQRMQKQGDINHPTLEVPVLRRTIGLRERTRITKVEKLEDLRKCGGDSIAATKVIILIILFTTN